MTPKDCLTDPKTPRSLRAFLESALAEPKNAQNLPDLYATTKREFAGQAGGGVIVKLKTGERVRVTNVGKFGDVGITNILEEPKAYQARASGLRLTFESWRGFPAE